VPGHLEREPYCRMCAMDGRTRRADHIESIAKRPDLRLDPSNLQSARCRSDPHKLLPSFDFRCKHDRELISTTGNSGFNPMRRGPKNKPTALHKLHGTTRTRHKSRAPDAAAPGALDEPPADLTPAEQVCWRHAVENARPVCSGPSTRASCASGRSPKPASLPRKPPRTGSTRRQLSRS
jgi:hypothetical protein